MCGHSDSQVLISGDAKEISKQYRREDMKAAQIRSEGLELSLIGDRLQMPAKIDTKPAGFAFGPAGAFGRCVAVESGRL